MNLVALMVVPYGEVMKGDSKNIRRANRGWLVLSKCHASLIVFAFGLMSFYSMENAYKLASPSPIPPRKVFIMF